jgi:hypothetical protein
MADESRFHSTRGNPRVILFSDMTENSEYANVQLDGNFEKLGQQVAEKLKFDSDGATVYAFGVEGASGLAKQWIERTRDFWSAFFKQSNGYVVGFGSELNIPGSPAVVTRLYDVEVQVQGTPRFGRLRILADGKGQLQDSFLFFSSKANSLVEGSFVCRGADRCKLEAKTTAGTITLSPREEIILEGPVQKLIGRIGFPNDVIQGPDGPQLSSKALFEVSATMRQER